MNPQALKAWIRPMLWLAISIQLNLKLEAASLVVIFLLFSMLVLIPLARPTRGRKQALEEFWAVVLAAESFCFEASGGTALMVAGWLIITWRRASTSLLAWQRAGQRDAGSLCLVAADVGPAVGAAWLMAHRANWTPWGFDPLIVLLTAAHFHHAGFTLPWMAGLNAQAKPGRWTSFSSSAVLLGVPIVAVGITCTHFGIFRFVESLGVLILVLGALGVALSHIRRGFEKQCSIWTNFGFILSGVSLSASMLLALGFGLRYLIPQYALTLPQMWSIHGMLNAFGFGMCGLQAWRSSLTRSERPSADQTA